jgi:excisionase family DNA binding protein
MDASTLEIEDGAAPARKPRRLTVTIGTACSVSGLGPSTVWKLIKEKRLKVVRIGRRTLVTWESLRKLLTP